MDATQKENPSPHPKIAKEMERTEEDALYLAMLWATICILRRECPWDRKQTNESIKFKFIEEAYETVDAIDSGDSEKFKKEVADILLVALMHIRIAEDTGKFTLRDCLISLVQKLIAKHPHVFGERNLKTAEEVLKNWEKSKGKEVFNIPLALPSLYIIHRAVEKAKSLGDGSVHAKRGNSVVSPDKLSDEQIAEVIFSCAVELALRGKNPEDILRAKAKNFVSELSQKLSGSSSEKGR